MFNPKPFTFQQHQPFRDTRRAAAATQPYSVHHQSHTMHTLDERLHFLQHVPLFAELSGAELRHLADDFRPRTFQQGETIFHEGDPGQALYVVARGRIRIYLQNAEGQETSVVLYGPTALFGELAVIDERPRSASASAMEDTILYTLDRGQFREHLKQSPQLAFNFMQMLADRVRYNTAQMESLTLLDLPRRLARKLLELAGDYGRVESTGVVIDMKLTQSDLASLVGATRESINKALRAFRDEKLIGMAQGQITILDPDALRERL